MSSQDRPYDAPWGCLLRLFWFLLGNIILVIVAVKLLLQPTRWFSGLDVFYWSVVVLIVAARYAEIRYFQGSAGDGKLATLQDWRRFAIVTLLSAGGAWVAVHVLVMFGVSR